MVTCLGVCEVIIYLGFGEGITCLGFCEGITCLGFFHHCSHLSVYEAVAEMYPMGASNHT